MKFYIFDSSFTHLIHRMDADMNGSHIKVRVNGGVKITMFKFHTTRKLLERKRFRIVFSDTRPLKSVPLVDIAV